MKTKLIVIVIVTIIIGTTVVTTFKKFNLGGGTMAWILIYRPVLL